MRVILSWIILSVVAAGIARAEPCPEAAQRAKTVAPFLDENTVGLLHVDPARIAAGPLVDELLALAPEARELTDLKNAKEALQKTLAAWADAGGKDLYVVLSLAEVFDQPWYYLAPLSGQAKPEDLAAVFRLLGAKSSERRGDVLVIGRRETLARLRDIRPDPRPELEQAFAAAGDTAAQLLLLPPKHTARVVNEMMPRLPQEIGADASTILTQGLRWAALGIDVPPRLSLRLVVQSQDAQAAAALRTWVIRVSGLMGRQEAIRQRVPKFDELARLLTPELQGDRLVLTLNHQNQGAAALAAAFRQPLEEAGQGARRAGTANQLKQLALVMHVYHEAHKTFPAQASYGPDGKPLLSWRVHVLPLLEQTDLYRQFHLDEPWDSPHNRTLIDQMPAIFRSPLSQRKEKGVTTYLVPAGPATVFPGREAVSMKDIKDGTSNTILIVEAADDRAVPWTKPEDWSFDPEQPSKGLALTGGGLQAAFCDGSVRRVPLPDDPKQLRGLFTRAAGDRVSP